MLLEFILASDFQLLEQHLTDAANAISLIVLSFRLLDDTFCVNARQLERDRRVLLFADSDVSNSTSDPSAYTSQHFRTFAARNRGLD